MFHPEKIAAKIKAIETAKKVTLKEHSIEECVSVYEHFKNIEFVDGNSRTYCRANESPKIFKYTKEEAQWISNEMYMCACSFPYWYYRYFFISVNGVIKRPDFLIAQAIFLAILTDLDLLGLPILLLILKARQLGISTVVEAIILWIAIFHSGSKCVVASAEEEKSEDMSNMVWLGLEMMPLWMQPVLTREDAKLGPEFGLIHSEILLQHGSMTKGISRGSTPIAAHLSEVAYYPDPITTIESSLIRAMHENPRTFLALETTAKKKDDWFHRTWKKNRKGEQEGYNRFTCLFLPWYVGRDKYPTKDWIINHPVPRHWKIVDDGRNEDWRLIQGKVASGPLKETYKQASDARLYVATTPLLSQHMPENWEMPVEQMWFWEFNYFDSKEGGDETYKSFLAELAADERSAFQSKKMSVFTQNTLDNLRAEMSEKFQAYAVVGDGIDKRFHLLEFQSHSKRRIDIDWNPPLSNEWLHWKLIPLKEVPEDDNLKYYLKVWEHPKPGYDYVIGIDIASGQGLNNTVYFVLKVGKDGEPDEEVALLCSPWIASPESPAFANALGIYYGQYMSPYKEALLAPEVQKAVGDFISFQLAKLGYSNFYYMERFDIRKSPGQRPNRRGWASLLWSQQMMKEAFEHAIKHDWIKVNSEELVAELEYLESDETEAGRVVYDHAKDQTDDTYVAGGIAYFVAHGHHTIMERMKGNIKPKKKPKAEDPGQQKESGVSLLARQLQREDRMYLPSASEEGEGNPRKFYY